MAINAHFRASDGIGPKSIFAHKWGKWSVLSPHMPGKAIDVLRDQTLPKQAGKWIRVTDMSKGFQKGGKRRVCDQLEIQSYRLEIEGQSFLIVFLIPVMPIIIGVCIGHHRIQRIVSP